MGFFVLSAVPTTGQVLACVYPRSSWFIDVNAREIVLKYPV